MPPSGVGTIRPWFDLNRFDRKGIVRPIPNLFQVGFVICQTLTSQFSSLLGILESNLLYVEVYEFPSFCAIFQLIFLALFTFL